jgi:hypothetical protein
VPEPGAPERGVPKRGAPEPPEPGPPEPERAVLTATQLLVRLLFGI